MYTAMYVNTDAFYTLLTSARWQAVCHIEWIRRGTGIVREQYIAQYGVQNRLELCMKRELTGHAEGLVITGYGEHIEGL